VRNRASRSRLFGTVRAAADYDGDGTSDLVIGAPANFGTWSTLGTVHLQIGLASGVIESDTLVALPDSVGNGGRRGDIDAHGHGDVAFGSDWFSIRPR
jgi:hypothetical protein